MFFSELITSSREERKDLWKELSNITIALHVPNMPQTFADEERTNDEIEQRMRKRKRSSAAFDVEANQINLRSRNSWGERAFK